MEYPTCSTCKHFVPARYAFEKGYGTCRIAESGEGQPVIENAAMYGWDSEGYSAGLAVLPTFGCNQHVAKETT